MSESRSDILGKAVLILGLVLLVAAGAVSLYVHGVQPTSRHARSKNNLRQVLVACHLYADDNANQFPPTLEHLYPKYLNDREILGLPPVGQEGTPRYTLVPFVAGTMSGPQVVIYETEGDRRGGRNVGYSDGSVTWVRGWQPPPVAGAAQQEGRP